MNEGIRKANLSMTAELVAEKLGLQDDIKILAVRSEPWTGKIDFLLESERFKPITEGQVPPTVHAAEAVFKNDKLYTRVLRTGLTYGEAISALRIGDEGTKVTRQIWSGYWTYEKLEGLSRPILVATLRGTAERVPATAYQEDQLATDWMIVE